MGTLFYTVIFNARAHDAKRCLFIHNVAEVISASKQSLRSPIISPVPPPMSTFAYLVQIAKIYTSAKLEGDSSTDSTNTFVKNKKE